MTVVTPPPQTAAGVKSALWAFPGSPDPVHTWPT
jgi:hypothetical protein